MIRNSQYQICRLCRHLIPTVEIYSARCSKTGQQCKVSGEIKYDFAEYSRRNDTLCGEQGRYFEPIVIKKADKSDEYIGK